MLRPKLLFLIGMLFLTTTLLTTAQDADKKNDVHEFDMIYEVESTPVKDQGRSGTCWAFATTSFIESEILRMGKGEFDLSEMYNVRCMYPDRAESYVRYHGRFNFGCGGQAHDVMSVVKNFGIMPENIYSGYMPKDTAHNHSEMDAVLKATVDAVVKKTSGKITRLWQDVIDAELNIYLGTPPEKFVYENKEYTPESFRDYLGINPDDYIEFTSYSHHPFYEPIDLEIPDNYRHSLYYNIPIDDLLSIMDNALENGYSIAWDGDVGKKNFLRDEGYAVIPVDKDNKDDSEEPEVEKDITQEERQESFDSYDTTDDHLMHIVGLAEDQEETKFYYIKNSWGVDDYKYGGFWYMSEPFVKLRTVAIMVHKNAVPQQLKEKLGL